MPVERYHEHSFDLSMIRVGDWVLDIGCRDFRLASMFLDMGINVVAVDADPNVSTVNVGVRDGVVFMFVSAAVLPKEIAAQRKITTLHMHPNDQQAHTTVRPQGGRSVRVPTHSLGALREMAHIKQFALMKLDCEGSEYALMHDVAWYARHSTAIARQVSVEYHDHCGLSPERDMERWYARLHHSLGAHYDVTKHVREVPPWNGPPHFVDSLYTLRAEHWV